MHYKMLISLAKFINHHSILIYQLRVSNNVLNCIFLDASIKTITYIMKSFIERLNYTRKFSIIEYFLDSNKRIVKK